PTFRSPTFRSPTYRSPTFRSPTFRSNTFSLAPGEEAVCTLRFIVPQEGSSGGSGAAQGGPSAMEAAPSGKFDPRDYAKTVAGSAVAQAANPDGQIHFASSLYIVEKSLPPASVNDGYAVQLEAFGGEPVTRDDRGTSDPGDDICTYEGKWTPATLFYATGEPSGLSVDASGLITGTPIYDPDVAYPQVLSFMAEVTDNSTPPQLARRSLNLTVACILHPVKVAAGPFGDICWGASACVRGGLLSGDSAYISVPHGGSLAFTIMPYPCFDISGVTVRKGGDPVFSGRVSQYTLADVRSDDWEIGAAFVKISYRVVAGIESIPASPPGGTISPAGEMFVDCGASITFTIVPADGYRLADVTDNGVSKGLQAPYTIANVTSTHEVVAKFRALESWVRRYNNDAFNGDDEARAIAVHRPSGNIFVTGYSTGRTTGADMYTIRYGGDGASGWSSRYDGPSHLGDYANAVAAGAAGNAYVAGLVYRGNVVKHADYATLNYDTAGNIIWNLQYDDRRNGNDEIRALAVDALGFVYVTGRSEDSQTKTDVKHYDYYTIKYDPTAGSVVWAARYNSSLTAHPADEASGIAVDASGNVYVTGKSQKSLTDFDYLTIKYSSLGVEQWVKRYDGGYGDDEATGVAVDASGNICVTGRSKGAGGFFNAVTIKYDPSGIELWMKTYDNGQGDDEAAAIAVDKNGDVVVTGRSQGGGTGFDYITLKYAAGNGSQLWAGRLDNTKGADEAVALALDDNNDVYVTGRSQASAGGFDYLTARYSSSGSLIWRARYNNAAFNGADEASAIALDASGNVYVTGRSQGGATGFDYATVKYKGQTN
ncbi:MAG TPA: SBBP repeat-containing protein, partial [Acidobacteriota bacterium]|nr:SBBP repeat-containing protein [Acidobacteriota bacterium]